MRPDVAQAFDRMSAAARRDSVHLVISSAFRSDAEQAILFARNPDPKWVAPPGESLHRNATELDLGPPSAYAWLAANAGRFHFLMRYAWEPWHYDIRLALLCFRHGTMGWNRTGVSHGRPAIGRGQLPR